jgi:hypothetical protein
MKDSKETEYKPLETWDIEDIHYFLGERDREYLDSLTYEDCLLRLENEE